MGTGPENSSILTSKDHDVALEKHSLLLLVPAQWSVARASGEPGSAAQPESGEPTARIPAAARTAALPPKPPLNDIDLCAPPQCNVALPSGNAIDVGHAAATISIRELGRFK